MTTGPSVPSVGLSRGTRLETRGQRSVDGKGRENMEELNAIVPRGEEAFLVSL